MHVRDVTAEEIMTYERDGWVKLEGLIDADTCAELLEAGKRMMQDTPITDDYPKSKTGEKTRVYRTSVFFSARNIQTDPFYSFMLSPEIGRLAQQIHNRKRLTDEPVGVRYCEDALFCKGPVGDSNKHNMLGYHQDMTFGTDRVGGFNLWIALDDVSPEQGAIRFLTGSHREGALGGNSDDKPLLERYPKLLELYEWSPDLHYRPGDATVHHGYTIHGSADNLSDKPRWSYIPTYIPADCVVVNENTMLGLPEPHERFPLLKTPA